MIRIPIILLSLITISGCMAKNTPLDFKDYSVGEMLNSSEYRLYMSNEAGDTITLEHYKLFENTKSNDTDSLESSKNDLMNWDIWAPPIEPHFIASTVGNNSLIVLCARAGALSLKMFVADSLGVRKNKEYFVDHHFLISGANGGGVSYTSRMLWINSVLYMYINGGQMYGGKVNGLYKFDMDKAMAKNIADSINKVEMMNFSENTRYILMFCMRDRDSYERYKGYENASENLKIRLDTMSKYVEKPYYYRTVSSDERQRNKLSSDMWNYNLGAYSPFSDCPHCETDSTKITEAQKYINEVLAFSGFAYQTPVTFMGYLESSSYMTYFFYTPNRSEGVKIIRFDSYNGNWIISENSATESKPRQLWFRAGDK